MRPPAALTAVVLVLAGCGGGEDARPAEAPITGGPADPGRQDPVATTPAELRGGGRDLVGRRVVVRGRLTGSGVEPAPALELAGGGASVLAVLPESLEGAATDLYHGERIVVRGVVRPFTDALDAIRNYPIEEPGTIDRRGELVVIADRVALGGR